MPPGWMTPTPWAESIRQTWKRWNETRQRITAIRTKWADGGEEETKLLELVLLTQQEAGLTPSERKKAEQRVDSLRKECLQADLYRKLPSPSDYGANESNLWVCLTPQRVVMLLAKWDWMAAWDGRSPLRVQRLTAPKLGILPADSLIAIQQAEPVSKESLPWLIWAAFEADAYILPQPRKRTR